MLTKSYLKLRTNWLNRQEHQFIVNKNTAVDEKFEELFESFTENEERSFEGHFGMEHCLIHAKEVEQFVYHSKKESAHGTGNKQNFG